MAECVSHRMIDVPDAIPLASELKAKGNWDWLSEESKKRLLAYEERVREAQKKSKKQSK